jgi:class 3 adenylate cyclase/tetratricopeptide (TPR) repeat protein
MQKVVDWLRDLGLPQYGPAFERNAITPELLEKLNDADLKELGVSMLGHRKRLLMAIELIRKNGGRLPADQYSGLSHAPMSMADTANPMAVPTAERRQITVLFCDLVGSTQMAAALDPEDMRQVIRNYHGACQSVIESYGGNVAQFLGDGVMAYFGWPIAHEDDAERALRSALELTAAIKALPSKNLPLQIRIGIASGPVVVGKGDDARDNSTLAVGEAPNLAARLQTLAEPGQIMMTHATHKLAKNLFQYADMGSHALKGFDTPVQVWRLEGDAGSASRFDGRDSAHSAFVGREAEAAQLKQLWQQTLHGEGQVVLLLGESGIGKSRTAKLLEEHIANEPHTCLPMHASPFHINSAFHPIIKHFIQTADITDHDSQEEKLAKVRTLMHENGESSPHAVGLIANLLGLLPPGTDPDAGMTPRRKKEQTIKYLCAMIGHLSERNPALIIFEDMHWLDASSFEVIEQLMLLARTKRIMLLATSRSDPPSHWVGKPHLSLLRLNRLSGTQSKELIDTLCENCKLPEELKRSIAGMTDGIPLFIEELTKSLQESDQFKPTAGKQDFSMTKTMLTVPLTLRDSLMARLDRLAFGREVAQIASCIGPEFDFSLLSMISPYKGETLGNALALLQLAGLVMRKKVGQKEVYVFKHRMVQEVAYESLLKSLRLQLHGRIATAMEGHFPDYASTQPELLAHHFTAADLPQKALVYWQRAGALALHRMAVQEAASHVVSALQQLQYLPESASRDATELELRTSLGTAWMALRGWAAPQIAEHLERTWQLSQSLGVKKHSLSMIWGMWVQLHCAGRVRDSMRWAQHLLSEAKRIGDRDMHTAGRMAACVSHFYLGEFHESLRYAESLIDEYDPVSHANIANLINHDPKTIGGIQKAFCLWMLGKPESALKLMHDALAHAYHRGHLFDTCYTIYCVGALAGQIGDADEYVLRVEELKRIGIDLRLPFFEKIMAGLSHASWLQLSNRAVDAKTAFEQVMPLFITTGMGIALTRYMTLSALSHAQAGEFALAFRELEQVFEQIERPGWEEHYYYAEALRIKGELNRLSGNVAEAETHFVAAIERARQQSARSWELRAATSLATLLSLQGRRDEARKWLAPVLQAFDEGFDMPDLQQATTLMNELQTGNVIQLTKKHPP